MKSSPLEVRQSLSSTLWSYLLDGSHRATTPLESDATSRRWGQETCSLRHFVVSFSPFYEELHLSATQCFSTY
jgi:hypothetical protein